MSQVGKGAWPFSPALVSHWIWAALGRSMTLDEAVIFNQYNPQRGWTAEACQLTTFVASGGIRFPFPKGDLVAEPRVPVH